MKKILSCAALLLTFALLLAPAAFAADKAERAGASQSSAYTPPTLAEFGPQEPTQTRGTCYIQCEGVDLTVTGVNIWQCYQLIQQYCPNGWGN